jgi:glyoxylase-like metal-dependent hydrolase (beta-lactamase superfamily II)
MTPLGQSFRKLTAPRLEPIARGVWVMRGDFPWRVMNVYFLEGEGGVTVFDAGIESMGPYVAEAGRRMGGIERVVLGHAHEDHRGAAPAVDAPVWCHPDEVAYAEASGPTPYIDTSKLDRALFRTLMPKYLEMWDGGPVKVAGTVTEGDEVAGFEVVHFPGHAPGLIGLWRSSDRLALASDVVYTLDPQTLPPKWGGVRTPHHAYNWDQEKTRESARKLAGLDPETVWCGHADPITSNVKDQLLRAAEA